MASWYVLRDQWGMITSHDPVHLMLVSAIRQIQGCVINVDISSFRDTKITTPLTEYLLKPKELNGMCWYDYLEQYIIVKKSFVKSKEYYQLHSNHPNSKSHVVIERGSDLYKNSKRKYAAVQYHGYSLKPSIRRDTPEKIEIFSMSVLVMFKPYTCISDIKGGFTTYRDALYDINGNMRLDVLNPIGYKVIAHNEDRWTTKFSSEQAAKHHRKDIEIAARDISVEYDDEGFITQIIADESVCEEVVYGDCEVYNQNYYDFMVGETNDIETETNCEPIPCKNYPVQLTTIHDPDLNEKRIEEGYKMKNLLNSRRCAYLERFHYQQAVEVQELINAAIDTLLPDAENSSFTEIRRKYEIPQNEYIEYHISEEKGKIRFPICSSLQEIVDIFGFSKDQKKAFVIGAISLLKNIGEEEGDESSYLQVFGLVQGLAGSGKSHVIKAWNVLALSWGKEYAVQCVCMTGIAASYINGRTIHSLLHITEAEVFAMKLLIIDEVLYMYCAYLFNFNIYSI